MRRILVAALAAALGAGTGVVVLDAAAPVLPSASALAAGDVIGRYNVTFKGDAWVAHNPAKAAATGGYHNERVLGAGRIEIVARDETVNDGLVTVRVLLDDKTRKTALGGATPASPAFEGTAALIGQSISVIASGQPNFVNALTLRFDKPGVKVGGTWMAVYPALERDLVTQKFATGVTVSIAGRRARRDAPR